MVSRTRLQATGILVVALLGAMAGCQQPDAPAPPRSARAPQTYAWLLNGDRHKHHTSNIYRATQDLLRLGVPPENLFVASAGRKPHPLIPRAQFGVADLQHLTAQHALLKGRATRNSTLLVYITGHGSKSRRGRATNTFVALHRSYALNAKNLLEMVEPELSFAHLILVIDTCYGGGFVKTFHRVKGSYTGASPTNESQSTFCQPFAPHFWNHLNQLESAGIREAFDEALKGCKAYQNRGRCSHAPHGCPSYRKRSTFRQKDS